MRRLGRLGVLAFAALILGAWQAEAGRWGKDYVPNVPVVTQDGKTLNFYDDLIKDKIVVLSFIYTSCKDICPLATSRLGEARELLGDRVGRDIFLFHQHRPGTRHARALEAACRRLPRRPGLAVPDRSAGGHSVDPLQSSATAARTLATTATT